MEKIKNKMINHIKENKNLIIIMIFFAIALFGIIMNRPIQQTDELLLFNNTQKMVNGYKIYKDFNVLITPIFYYVGCIILKIFACNYFVFRFYGICIYLFLYYNIYKLFEKLNISSKHSFIYLCLLTIFLKDEVIALCGANYNILAIAFSILAMRHFIKNDNKNYKFFIIQGILTIVIFLTKQTIGVYEGICFVLCYVIFEKIDTKLKIKNLIFYCIGSIASIALFAIYLICNNSLYEFIDYTILGIFDFKQNTTVESYVIIWALISIIPTVILWIKKEINTEQKILFIYSLLMLLITYPILCEFHSRMALIYSMISVFYLIDRELVNETIENIIYDIILLSIVIFTIINIYTWNLNKYSYEDEAYNGVVYNSHMNSLVHNITSYIQKSDKKIIFISLEACRYNNILGGNNGILDCPAKGNMGYNGYEKLMDAIKNLPDDTRIMLTSYYYVQEYTEMYDYIRENYTKVDTIYDYYEVYEKIVD